MTEKDDGRRSSGTEIQAVERAAQILALFGSETPEITAAIAAKRLHLNRTTTYRYCVSLETAGLLKRGRSLGTFVPGALLAQLGVFALGRRQVVEQAIVPMRELCAATGMTTVLSLWGPRGAQVSLVEEDTTREVLTTVRVGTLLAPSSAQSKLFYAHSTDRASVDRLIAEVPEKREREVLTDIQVLAGTDAVAVSPDGFGAHAIAAPIFDESGICATLAIIGPADLVVLDRDSAIANQLRSSSRALSAAMGGRPPPVRI